MKLSFIAAPRPLGKGKRLFLRVVGPVTHYLVDEDRQSFTKSPESGVLLAREQDKEELEEDHHKYDDLRHAVDQREQKHEKSTKPRLPAFKIVKYSLLFAHTAPFQSDQTEIMNDMVPEDEIISYRPKGKG